MSTSCVLVQPRLPALAVPPERFVQPGFSLVPLNEKGWYIGRRDASGLILGKRGDHDDTFSLEATTVALPPSISRDDLVRLVRKDQANDTNPPRFKMLKHEVNASIERANTCARSQMVIEDQAPVKRSGRPGPMIMEVFTLTCVHPKRSGIGIHVAFSQRYYPEHRDAQLLEKATRVFNSIEFTD